MSETDDISACLVLNTVAAARTLLRRYDARLKPFGVTVQQFALMSAIRRHPGETLGALAGKVFMDRTSLTRNLDLLERKGLVERVAGRPGNVRTCRLSAQGDAVLDQLLPLWRAAQAELRQGMNEDEAGVYLRIAAHLGREG